MEASASPCRIKAGTSIAPASSRRSVQYAVFTASTAALAEQSRHCRTIQPVSSVETVFPRCVAKNACEF